MALHRHIAFLRGINLGNRRLKMDDLRALFEKMKFAHVETFIASGNVIFDSKSADSHKITDQIQTHLRRALGYDVDTFVHTRAEVAALASFEPFKKTDMVAPGHTIYCSFVREPLSPAQVRGMLACRTEVDDFCVAGREFYWLCRIKSNDSKVWDSPQMRALKLPSSSMRNLTTLRKLAIAFPV